ncbi:hypothetical protein BJY04DRAFT_227120 [Aspergillus karnatakaensis]|uniref:flavin-containing monooxygenase n=1 Tax=Aspergillus karnatakaensis TaxID=1810916 RepID=UPI003CCD36F7
MAPSAVAPPQHTDEEILNDLKGPLITAESVSLLDESQDSLPRTINPPFVLESHPVDEKIPLKAIVIGAGITGITAGILLPAKVPGLSLTIYERYTDIGGVWHANTYPGVRCDVPSHVYQSTFSPSTTWSENYSRGAEIKHYWKSLATKYDVWKYITTNTEVLDARWSDSTAKWTVSIRTTNPETGEVITKTDESDFVILSSGRFSRPTLPNIPGIEGYRGRVIHTGAWDTSFDPAGKTVALIGNGASGLQILPELQKVATRVDHYTRNPTWVAGSLGKEKLSRDIPISEDLKSTWSSNSEEYHKYRKELESQAWSRFAIVEKGGEVNKTAREEFKKLMAQRLGDRQDLLPLVLPDFAPNCRRLTPGPGYLEAIGKPNVEYIRTPISTFTESGLRTDDGKERDVDAVICATGAATNTSPAIPIYNGKGENLQSSWSVGGDPGFPDTYLGMAAPNFPNLLFVLGPNSGSGFAGTVPHTIETQVTYIAKVLRKVSSQRIRTITPSQAAVRDFRAYCESFFPTTVLSETCSSWYNNHTKNGRIVAVWPGSGAHVHYIRKEVRWEDFEYTHHNPQGNRFGYFGNGWTRRDVEAKGTGDRVGEIDFAYYLKQEATEEGGVDLRGYHEQWWEA